jgi:hypothetical protein
VLKLAKYRDKTYLCTLNNYTLMNACSKHKFSIMTCVPFIKRRSVYVGMALCLVLCSMYVLFLCLLFCLVFGARAPTSSLLLVTCFLVQLTSRPLRFVRAVFNTVITNIRATVKNCLSLNYDWLRFSGSVQEERIIGALQTCHSEYCT